MSRKSKFSFEVKMQAVTKYLNGKGSLASIAAELGTGKATIRDWISAYKFRGPESLQAYKHNQSYSKAFKLRCVEAYISGKGSLIELANKYGLRSHTQLKLWIIKYNSHQEIKDYDPVSEVYKMANIRKTTKQERQEIVRYCLNHNSNYKETAKKYGCTYAQVYNWCKKYKLKGTDGLNDNRGRRRNEAELSELEKATRKIKDLKRMLEISQRENEFLKKVKDLERTWLLDSQNKDK